METSKTTQRLSIAGAVLFALVAMTAGYIKIGIPPVAIVGGSSVIGMFFWIKTYLRKPLDPRIILPPFLLTVAALEVHMAEEYLAGFGPAISRLFDASWSEQSFLMIFAFIGPALYALTAIGLFYRKPLAGFMAWFIFIGPKVSATNEARGQTRTAVESAMALQVQLAMLRQEVPGLPAQQHPQICARVEYAVPAGNALRRTEG